MPFFFKQWGGVRKSATGRTLDDRTHDDQPAVRDAEMPPRRLRLQLVGDGGFDRATNPGWRVRDTGPRPRPCLATT